MMLKLKNYVELRILYVYALEYINESILLTEK